MLNKTPEENILFLLLKWEILTPEEELKCNETKENKQFKIKYFPAFRVPTQAKEPDRVRNLILSTLKVWVLFIWLPIHLSTHSVFQVSYVRPFYCRKIGDKFRNVFIFTSKNRTKAWKSLSEKKWGNVADHNICRMCENVCIALSCTRKNFEERIGSFWQSRWQAVLLLAMTKRATSHTI